MARYIFTNVPAYGHVNPTLAVVEELVRRGEEVIYYLTEEFRPAIEATGATFRSYETSLFRQSPSFDPAQAMNGRTGSTGAPGTGVPMPLRMADESEAILGQVFERIRADRPDYILYDMMCMWGKIVASALNVPAILLRVSYATNKQFNISSFSREGGMGNMARRMMEAAPQVNRKYTELAQKYGGAPVTLQDMFAGAELLTIVFLPREFQPDGASFDERFVFVGPSIHERHDRGSFPLERLDGQNVLYISLGTAFNNQPQFFNMCFAAFKDSPWLVVLSRGKRVDPAALDATPDNFLVAPYIPQLEVLSRTSLFITHGGMNSTMESLYYGVPMIAVPQMPEQALTAHRIQELGMGIALQNDQLNVETLRESVARVSGDPSFLAHVKEMQPFVRNAGGAQRAADAIIEFARK